MGDLGDDIPKVSLAGTTLKNDDVAFPCGLIAKYFFDDTFSLVETKTSIAIPIDETNIAHTVDKDYKFKFPTTDNYQ